MANKFFILEIKGMTDSVHGNCVAVYANPIQETNIGCRITQSYTPDIGSETKIFFFPEDDSVIQPVIRIARSQQVWEPYIDDFTIERIFDEKERIHKEIYRHCSCFKDNYKSLTGDINPLTINRMKFNQLEQRYMEYMRINYMNDPIDMQQYVSRIAETDPSFFTWLFDDSALKGCNKYNLDEEQRKAWNDFYERLYPYYENN